MAQRDRSMPDLWRGSETWNPITEISRLQRGIDRMFENFLSPVSADVAGPWQGRGLSFSPSVDVEETEDSYLMTFDLPGVKKEDVKIELRENQLFVSGERRDERGETGSQRSRERFYGAFQRVFALPQQVDPEKIEASYEDGVLYLAVPKSEAVKSRAIPISEKKSGIFSRMLGKDEKKTEAQQKKSA